VTDEPRPSGERARVSPLTLLRVLWRSLFLQACWNPRGMQNVGFAFAMEPALRELYPDGPARARATERHLEFFNCHPYLAAAIVGGAVRLEEEVARGAAEARRVSAFKSALAPPFAALGDGFFWLALRPAAALIAAVSEPYLGLWSVVFFLALYDGVHLAARAWLFFAGYLRGEEIVAAVSHVHLPQTIAILKGSAAVLAGVIAGRSVVIAGLPHRPWHAVLIALLIVALWGLLPRMGLTAALYTAMALGLALGGGFL
jgi:PTS system mannose-specific IID component